MNGKDTNRRRRQSKKISKDNINTSCFTQIVKQYVKCFDCGHIAYGEEGHFISDTHCSKCNSENISANRTLSSIEVSKHSKDMNLKRIISKAEEYKSFMNRQNTKSEVV